VGPKCTQAAALAEALLELELGLKCLPFDTLLNLKQIPTTTPIPALILTVTVTMTTTTRTRTTTTTT